MSAIYQESSELNDAGVRHYVSGEWTKALDCFKRALQTIVTHVSVQNEATRNKPAVANASGNAIASLERSHLWEGIHSTSNSSLSSFSDEPEKTGSLVFDQPLVFEQMLWNGNDASAVGCACLVFNMALAAHQKYYYSRNAIYLTKALQLYESSIEFFSKASRYVDFAGVVAAAYNNKVHLYYEEDRFDELERDLSSLYQVAMIAHQTIKTDTVLDETDFQGILLNLFLLRRPITAQAA